jgi:membrane protease YdiL (CAAX protease family)
VLKVLAVLNVVVFFLPTGSEIAPERGLEMRAWIGFLPLTLFALLLQTGAEEVLFRGYLQSQLAARLAHPMIWLVVPSALFAVGHYAPEYYGDNAGLVTLWSFVFGVAAADLTARSGTLGPAIALHFVNNFMAIAVNAIQGDMSGLALWVYPFDPSDTEAVRALLPLDLMMIAVSWLSARVALRL